MVFFAAIVAFMSSASTVVCQGEDTNSSVALSQQSGTDIDSQYSFHRNSDDDRSKTDHQEIVEIDLGLFPDSTEAQICAALLELDFTPVVKDVYQGDLKSSM